MSKFLPTRRATLFGFAASLGAMVTAPLPLLALTQAQASDLVGRLVGEINRVIASGKSESAMIRDFERIFVKYADVPIMARYALGADARRVSQAQMRRFTSAFQGYISRKYGKRFGEFIGGRVEVNSSRKINAGYEIRTTAFLRGQSPFAVTFLVSNKSGRDRFFNMFIEGVNLLLTERQEIGALLDRRGGDVDQMIADLERAG